MFIYGKNAVIELLNSDYKVLEIIFDCESNVEDIVESAKNKRITIKEERKKNLDKLVDSNSQGIVAKISEYRTFSIEDIVSNKENGRGLIVILDQITDVNNFASIVRVCECAGVDGIIIPKDRSVKLNSAIGKISSGAIFYSKICVVTNLNQAIKKLKDYNYWVVAGDLQGQTSYTDVDYNMNVALVIGSEGKGIRESTRKSCDYLVKIPMFGEVNSLNASVSCGILTYQIINSREE